MLTAINRIQEYPTLLILDKNGHPLVAKGTGDLEENCPSGCCYNPHKIFHFLRRWKPGAVLPATLPDVREITSQAPINPLYSLSPFGSLPTTMPAQRGTRKIPLPSRSFSLTVSLPLQQAVCLMITEPPINLCCSFHLASTCCSNWCLLYCRCFTLYDGRNCGLNSFTYLEVKDSASAVGRFPFDHYLVRSFTLMVEYLDDVPQCASVIW